MAVIRPDYRDRDLSIWQRCRPQDPLQNKFGMTVSFSDNLVCKPQRQIPEDPFQIAAGFKIHQVIFLREHHPFSRQIYHKVNGNVLIQQDPLPSKNLRLHTSFAFQPIIK